MYHQRRTLYQRLLHENAIVANNNPTYCKSYSFEYTRQRSVQQPVTPDRLFSLPLPFSHKARSAVR